VSGLLGELHGRIGRLGREQGFLDARVEVTARPLAPAEAIGRPEHDDYPIIRGRERMMEALFEGAAGHAFTDHPGRFSGTLAEVLAMPLADNFRRAVFLATANAVARRLGLAQRTVHCKDADLTKCPKELPAFVRAAFGAARRVFLVGLQPRFLETLAEGFELRVTDLDAENIGRKKAGIPIEPAEAAADCLAWCDAVLATGSTLANGSAEALLGSGKPVAFYGVTCAAATALLDLPRFCPLGR